MRISISPFCMTCDILSRSVSTAESLFKGRTAEILREISPGNQTKE
jgi:hypothetical protein